MKQLLLAFLWIAPIAYAQEPKSLEACIEIAWAQNPDFANSALSVEQVKMDYIASIGSFLPQVRVSGEVGRNVGRTIDPTTNNYTTETFDQGSVGLELTLSLFEGLSRLNRVRFEKINQQKSQFEHQERKNDLAYRVIEAYYRLLFEQQMLVLAIEQKELGRRYVEQTEAFVALGLKSRSDLSQVRARSDGDAYRCTIREHACRLGLLELKELLHMPHDEPLVVQELVGYQTLPEFSIPQTDRLYAQSLEVVPGRQVVVLEGQAARRAYDQAAGRFSPTVFARYTMGSRYLDGFSLPQLSDNIGQYVGLGISIPVLDGLERITNLRKHKLDITKSKNDLQQAEQQLYTQVEQTVLALEAGRVEHQQAATQMAAEEQVLQESERKWAEGLLSIFELIEARNRLIGAKAELVRVRIQIERNINMERYYRTGNFI